MANSMKAGFLRDDTTGALVVTGSSPVGLGAVAPGELKRRMWLPTGLTDPSSTAAGDTIDESSPRLNGAQTVTLASGTAYAVGNMVVPAGRTVDSITFQTAGSGASGITGYFFALVKQDDLTVLARSADATAAWAGNTARTLLMATPWTATEDTPVYAVICMVASGMPSLSSYASHIQSINRTPVFGGSSNTGLTNAASLPSPINAPVQAAAGLPYASINSLTSAPASDVSEGLLITKAIGTISSDGQIGIIGAAQFPMQLQALSLVSSGSLSANDTNYWSLALGKIPALSSTFGGTVATRTTQATGGASVFQYQAFTFDAATWDSDASVFTKDDVIAVKATKVGSPASISSVDATLRYLVL